MHQERNDPVNKTRVQIDLLPGELERMNIVMRMTDLSTRKDLFNNALSLFEWAVTEVARGREIGSVTADGEITILTMPAFKSAANYGPLRISKSHHSTQVYACRYPRECNLWHLPGEPI
jgi:hypothetical protein